MEDVLWEVSIEGRGVDFSDGIDNNVIFANNPGLSKAGSYQGWSRFPPTYTDVRLPTWQRYTEALVPLTRSTTEYERYYWQNELNYIEELGNPDRLRHPAFRDYIKAWDIDPRCPFLFDKVKMLYDQAKMLLDQWRRYY